MRRGLVFALLFALLFAAVSARVVTARLITDDAFGVNFWAQPKIILNGAEEEDFYRSLKEVLFAVNISVAAYGTVKRPGVVPAHTWQLEFQTAFLYLKRPTPKASPRTNAS